MKVLSNLSLISFVLWVIDTKVQEENVYLLSIAELDSFCPKELCEEHKYDIIDEHHKNNSFNVMLRLQEINLQFFVSNA